jgi:hypothetical protein
MHSGHRSAVAATQSMMFRISVDNRADCYLDGIVKFTNRSINHTEPDAVRPSRTRPYRQEEASCSEPPRPLAMASSFFHARSPKPSVCGRV